MACPKIILGRSFIYPAKSALTVEMTALMLYMDDFNRTSSTPPTNWALFQPLLPSTGRITQYHKSKLDAWSRSVAGKWDTHFCLHLSSNDGEKKELD